MPLFSSQRLTLLLALLLVASGVARAEPPDVEARSLYQTGHALFEAGHYREAIAKFQAGYALSPRPVFLVNIGQAYRQLFEPARARESYVAFLAQAAPNDPARPEVEELVREIDRVLAAQAATAPHEAPQVIVAASPPRAPFVKRHWWIFPVAAVVIAGAGVGIYFGVHPPSRVSCSDATIDCLDAMR